MQKTFETKIGEKPLKVTIGEMAKQANGACFVEYGESAVLSTVCSKESESVIDFFPLMVIYQEKLYAAGKIPGGFLRREGRPSEHETLVSRLIDRPIRPLFPEGYQEEVQIVNTVLSSDETCSPSIASIFGSSLALMLSDLPFEGPIAGVTIGLIDNKFILNPSEEELDKSDLNLTVAGTKEAINMVEAGARFVDEETMWEALKYAHSEITKLCDFQIKIAKELDIKKKEYKCYKASKNLMEEIKDFHYDDIKESLNERDKQTRDEKLRKIRAVVEIDYKSKELNLLAKYGTDLEDLYDFFSEIKIPSVDLTLKAVNLAFDALVEDIVRTQIAVEKKRPDGRDLEEIRPLSSRIDVLKRTHGSALFTRGQTQSLGTVTLGSLRDNQIIDGLGLEATKRFMLHYNFPQFSVGETGRYGSPGRREIGHGALGERALSYVIPSEDEFPYTIRVVSEILESNGSSSQATICSGTLALMAAGVPIKDMVAGIAMGLIMKDKNNYTILTDIQGMEDHLGDMDFKVAGTRKGITALQMDIKVKGITYEILKEALMQAKKGRMELLDHMEKTISEPRKEVSEYAPKVAMTRIKESKIKDVIGSGGKTITAIIEKFDNVKIDIEQDGRVFIMHKDYETAKKCANYIEDFVREVEVNAMYNGTVSKIERFGAFVELWEGQDGLIHSSKIQRDRMTKIEDVTSVGDKVVVQVIKINEKNQADLKLIKNITKEVKYV